MANHSHQSRIFLQLHHPFHYLGCPLISRGQERYAEYPSCGPIIFTSSPLYRPCSAPTQNSNNATIAPPDHLSSHSHLLHFQSSSSRSISSLHKIIAHEGKRLGKADITSAIYNPLLQWSPCVRGMVPSIGYLRRKEGRDIR